MIREPRRPTSIVAAVVVVMPIRLNLGVEYLYGSHEQKDGAKGTASRVQFAAKYDFYRKRPLDEK